MSVTILGALHLHRKPPLPGLNQQLLPVKVDWYRGYGSTRGYSVLPALHEGEGVNEELEPKLLGRKMSPKGAELLRTQARVRDDPPPRAVAGGGALPRLPAPLGAAPPNWLFAAPAASSAPARSESVEPEPERPGAAAEPSPVQPPLPPARASPSPARCRPNSDRLAGTWPGCGCGCGCGCAWGAGAGAPAGGLVAEGGAGRRPSREDRLLFLRANEREAGGSYCLRSWLEGGWRGVRTAWGPCPAGEGRGGRALPGGQAPSAPCGVTAWGGVGPGGHTPGQRPRQVPGTRSACLAGGGREAGTGEGNHQVSCSLGCSPSGPPSMHTVCAGSGLDSGDLRSSFRS